jgi:predicted TIM-barrel fold metal-dependent hydrolase
MTIVDGWFNIFRLDADEPVQAVDAFLEPAQRMFRNGDGQQWLSTTLAEGLASLDAAGVQQALLTVSMGGDNPVLSRAPLVEVGLEACRRAEGRLKLVIALDDVNFPIAAARRLTEYAALDDVVGLGIFPSYLRTDLNDRKLYPLYAAAAEAGLFARINIGIVGPKWPSRHQHPLLLEDVLIDLPELTVIGAHMGHPWERMVIRLMMKFEQLNLMTSAYMPKYFAPEMVQFMNSSRGIGRVMFATDYPVLSIERAIAEARQLPLSERALNEYLGDALRRILDGKASGPA